MRALFIIGIILLFAGCKTVKESSTSVIHDSVYIYIHDSINERIDSIPITVVLKDSASIMALLKCDSMGQVQIEKLEILRGALINTQLSLRNNKLFIPISVNDSNTIYQILKSRYEKHTASNVNEHSEVVEIEKIIYKTRIKPIIIAAIAALIIGFVIGFFVNFKLF